MKCNNCDALVFYVITTLDMINQENRHYFCKDCAEVVYDRLNRDMYRYIGLTPLPTIGDVLQSLKDLRRDVDLRIQDIERDLNNLVIQ